MHAATPPSVGSTIELVFDLPTGEVRARAIVRSSTPQKGMGIQFIQMRPEDRAKLNRYLSRQSTSPEAPVVTAATTSNPANWRLAISPLRAEEAQRRFEREVRHLIELTGKRTYYQAIGSYSRISEQPDQEKLLLSGAQIPPGQSSRRSRVDWATQRPDGRHRGSLQNPRERGQASRL